MPPTEISITVGLSAFIRESTGPCDVHDWPTAGLARRLVEAATARHGKGGLNICAACVERAHEETLHVGAVMGAAWRVADEGERRMILTAFHDPGLDAWVADAASAELADALVREHNEALLRRHGAK